VGRTIGRELDLRDRQRREREQYLPEQLATQPLEADVGAVLERHLPRREGRVLDRDHVLARVVEEAREDQVLPADLGGTEAAVLEPNLAGAPCGD
jgi:hypothetical protein